MLFATEGILTPGTCPTAPGTAARRIRGGGIEGGTAPLRHLRLVGATTPPRLVGGAVSADGRGKETQGPVRHPCNHQKGGPPWSKEICST